MTPERAKAAADLLATVWEGEFPATCAVLAAVKDDNRWFIDSILNGSFEWDPEQVKRAEAQFTNVDDIVAFHKRTFPEKMRALRALPGDRLTATIDCFGNFNWPAVRYIAFANNHSVHRRGQLAAYLRRMGSKVPNIHGLSADDKD